jgi:pyrimidine oxygenase
MAERHGFDFALSMIKLRRMGGATSYWDHNLESFTLMAGLAAVTERIKLYASTAILTLPPALVARMAVTVDSIAPGRFGVNIVSGWGSPEYSQMGLWPGDDYFGYRYDYASEYVAVMRELWETGRSDFKGEHFTMDDCRLGPLPGAGIPIVSAGQSDRGMDFCADHADFNFVMAQGVNTPTAHLDTNERLIRAIARTGRDVGSYVLFEVIADETDQAAIDRWQHYCDGIDEVAVANMSGRATLDPTMEDGSTGANIASAVEKLAVRDASELSNAVNMGIGTLIGSYERVAAMLDDAAALPATAGIMLIFDDFVGGLDAFGRHVQPRMACRADRAPAFV